MAYGKIKADTLVYDNSGSDVEVTLASIGNKAPLASPTFTGTVTIPTPAANDNTTKAASTAYVQTELGDYAALAGATFTGNVVMSGNLTVQGTTTTISSTTIDVADKNLELGKVSTPTDTTADGGGITLKGATDKTITWTDATDTWDFNQDILVGHAGNANVTVSRNSGSSGTIKAEASKLTFGTTTNHEINVITNGTGRLTISNSGAATFTGTVSDDKGDVRSIPINTQSSSATYVAATSDAGKTIHAHSTTQTVELSGSTGFSAGDAVTIVNGDSTTLNITATNSLSLRNSADASTGNRALAQYGMATVYFTSATVAYISGAGLS